MTKDSLKAPRLKEFENQVKTCTKCPLHKTRKFPVPGEGNVDAKLMIIGLGPGYHENLQGRPFVGTAGKFLDELLELSGLKRGEVYITNIMKCYLPKNVATQDEIKMCTPYLDRQIKIIKPKIIITLGNIATSYLFQKFNLNMQTIGRIHGKVFQVSTLLLQTKIIPMYHPATALYNPRMKETLKQDWKKLKFYLGNI